MASSVTCPSCGGVNVLRNPGITTVVCEFCETTLHRVNAQLRAGTKAVVGEPLSHLRVGAVGAVGGRRVTLVGRLRFEADGAPWDEWYAEDDSGQAVWLTEDGKRYVLQAALPKAPEGAHPGLALGSVVTVGGRRFEVSETGVAVCVGGQGQLPRDCAPGERYPFLDLSELGGSGRLSLEFGPTEAEAFVGREIAADTVDFPRLSEHEQIDKGDVEAGGQITCPGCGGDVALKRLDEPLVNVVCPWCDRILADVEGSPRVVGQNTEKFDSALQVGDKGKLQGVEWEVIGRKVQREPGWMGWEFLLHSPGKGYRWLEAADGHYVLNRRTNLGPSLAELRTLGRKQKVKIAGQTFKVYEVGQQTVAYVDGAFPYEAGLGDTSSYVDLVAPPRVLSIEVANGQELERFVGDWLPAAQVHKAFGKDPPGKTWSVIGCSPNPVTRATKWMAVFVLGFMFLNFGVALSTIGSGSKVAAVQMNSHVAGTDASVESKPFSIPKGTQVVGLEFDTDVDNSWVYVTAELLDPATEIPLASAGWEVGYYHGYEGGESWTEGSKNKTFYVKAPEPGEYVLSMSLEADQPTTVTGTVHVGPRLARFNLILGILLFFWPLVQLIRYNQYETRRWED